MIQWSELNINNDFFEMFLFVCQWINNLNTFFLKWTIFIWIFCFLVHCHCVWIWKSFHWCRIKFVASFYDSIAPISQYNMHKLAQPPHISTANFDWIDKKFSFFSMTTKAILLLTFFSIHWSCIATNIAYIIPSFTSLNLRKKKKCEN